ncbi:MAG: acetyl-CoA carboxylase biotin carboxyl carrier protein subunit [Delftia tsuruhatensis]|uniref:acetyl-CoA carboxylase biotin carboxyl carrier protein subunit n=1 Tax=Delftia lacustris TaxID=558537 RepID=UPI0035A7167E
MEFQVVASQAGRIAAVHCKAGKAVAAGDALMVLEASQPGRICIRHCARRLLSVRYRPHNRGLCTPFAHRHSGSASPWRGSC